MVNVVRLSVDISLIVLSLISKLARKVVLVGMPNAAPGPPGHVIVGFAAFAFVQVVGVAKFIGSCPVQAQVRTEEHPGGSEKVPESADVPGESVAGVKPVFRLTVAGVLPLTCAIANVLKRVVLTLSTGFNVRSMHEPSLKRAIEDIDALSPSCAKVTEALPLTCRLPLAGVLVGRDVLQEKELSAYMLHAVHCAWSFETVKDMLYEEPAVMVEEPDELPVTTDPETVATNGNEERKAA